MRRVHVVGNSGSGKTTLARRLAAALDVPHLELDAENHQPGWVPLDRDEFRRRVGAFVAADGWVIDGNYSAVSDLIWERADTVVHLDPSRSVVMRRVLGRTLRRTVLRTELWNGNREPLSGLFRLDPMHSIIRWSWTRHATYRERYRAAAAAPPYPGLVFERVSTRAEADALVAAARKRGE